MSGHTPGPWTAQAKGCADAKVLCPDGRSFHVGDILYHPDNIANARLIASAPDLYAALRALVKASATADPREALEQANDALDKAEGK